ncbi:hypothetical protein EV126DRAFT_101224 [Verticillium dahliae]|nr:hypothetical protein EV126DRAFT_101224 [Verticillium dahliae]
MIKLQHTAGTMAIVPRNSLGCPCFRIITRHSKVTQSPEPRSSGCFESHNDLVVARVLHKAIGCNHHHHHHPGPLVTLDAFCKPFLGQGAGLSHDEHEQEHGRGGRPRTLPVAQSAGGAVLLRSPNGWFLILSFPPAVVVTSSLREKGPPVSP